jgi:hypothetical protein
MALFGSSAVAAEIRPNIFRNSVCQVQQVRAEDKIENCRDCYEAAGK